MTPPSLLARVMGYPPITFALLALYALLLGEWWADQIPFPLGFAVVFAVRKTMLAYDDRREFKESELLLGTEEEDLLQLPPPCRPYAGMATRVTTALISLHVSAVYLPQLPSDEIEAQLLLGIWWLSFLYLVWELFRVAWRLYRRFRRRNALPVPAEIEEDDVVTWMLDRPESAPSRAMAERELPDYCAALLKRSAAEGHQ